MGISRTKKTKMVNFNLTFCTLVFSESLLIAVSAATGWTCLQYGNRYVKLRKINGDIECGGTHCDKGGCYWAADLNSCQQLVPSRILQCGARHKNVYGITGYDTDGHWCSVSRSQSIPNQISDDESLYQLTDPIIDVRTAGDWTCVKHGYNYLKLRKINGEIECAKNHENNCHWVSNLNSCQRIVPSNSLQCGTEHKQLFGINGYDTYGHWCSCSKHLL